MQVAAIGITKNVSRKFETCKNEGLGYKCFDNAVPITYKKWVCVSENITDPKMNKTTKETKCLNKSMQTYNGDLIIS